MGGVEEEDAHALEDARVDAPDDVVTDFVVGHMAPPEENIGVGEERFGEAVFGLAEDGGLDAGFGKERLERGGEGGVDALGIEATDHVVELLVAEFVPDGDGERSGHGGLLEWGRV
jgi:hypothetical protein